MRRILQASLPILLALLVVSPGCGEDPASPKSDPDEDPEPHIGSWTIYTPYDWAHDGTPYYSDCCDVYSDAAGPEMKAQLGDLADDKFRRILDLFDFDKENDFRFPPGYSKLEIYVNRNHVENINWAYWGGFIFTIRSSDVSGAWYDYAVYTFRHELTHEFEFLITGREALRTAVWFREGLAVHIGAKENSVFKTIKSLSEVEAWISQNQSIPGQGNPIKINDHSDFPSGTNVGQYYRIFELAVRYILDSRGLGRSYGDVLNLLYDLRRGVAFHASFEDRLGISVGDYEDEFYDRITAYMAGSHE